MTAADVLRANRGVGPGFDALRLGLSVWVFTLHAVYICPGVEDIQQFAANPLHRVLLTPVLPMFFLVSGYLVMGSAMRTRALSTFLAFRIFRILPALLVEITLSAMVLGPWLTVKSLSEYFSSPVFYTYFLNIVGNAHFFLPGLFVKNPIAIVNVNLWTLRPEFYCYIFMSSMIISGIAFSRKYLSIISIAISALAIAYQIAGKQPINFIGLADWKLLVVVFVFGCTAYHWNDWLVMSKRNALIALVVAGSAFMYPPAIVLAFLALSYITIYIGMQEIRLPYFLHNGDYSYGIYLFGFPIQQTIVYFLPPAYRHGLSIMVLGLPLTLLFAMLSWKFIESPALQLRKKFKTRSNPATWSPPDLRFARCDSARQPADPAIS